MGKESGADTPTAEDRRWLDRARKGKKLSNSECEGPTDPDARIARLKDARSRPARKAEQKRDGFLRCR